MKKFRKFLRAVFWIILLAAALTGVIIAIPFNTGGEYDCLIVLGTTVEGSEPSRMLRDRIDAAYAILAADEDLTCIVTGGKGSNENISEAQCMYNELTAMGIDGSRIQMESAATSTLENIENSKALLSADARIGVLSSDFHMLRVQLLCKEADLPIVPVYAKSTVDWNFCKYYIREIGLIWYYAIF